MKFDEILQDEKLHIKTVGRDEKYSDEHHYPYEPTDYLVLERLAEEGYISQDNHLIDYGCGKGRVSFFLNNKTGCKCTGIEYVDIFYKLAKQNLESYRQYNKAAGIEFVCDNATQYKLPADADCFFFFNPFSIEIMRSVMQRILDSYYENMREMKLFFYYPQDEYVAYLMGVDELEFFDEIDCSDLFPEKTNRNRILIFTIE